MQKCPKREKSVVLPHSDDILAVVTASGNFYVNLAFLRFFGVKSLYETDGKTGRQTDGQTGKQIKSNWDGRIIALTTIIL